MAHNANYYLKIKGTVKITTYSCINIFLATVVSIHYIGTHMFYSVVIILVRGVILADIVILMNAT